jgi:hypothetical protein
MYSSSTAVMVLYYSHQPENRSFEHANLREDARRPRTKWPARAVIRLYVGYCTTKLEIATTHSISRYRYYKTATGNNIQLHCKRYSSVLLVEYSSTVLFTSGGVFFLLLFFDPDKTHHNISGTSTSILQNCKRQQQYSQLYFKKYSVLEYAHQPKNRCLFFDPDN